MVAHPESVKNNNKSFFDMENVTRRQPLNLYVQKHKKYKQSLIYLWPGSNMAVNTEKLAVDPKWEHVQPPSPTHTRRRSFIEPAFLVVQKIIELGSSIKK